MGEIFIQTVVVIRACLPQTDPVGWRHCEIYAIQGSDEGVISCIEHLVSIGIPDNGAGIDDIDEIRNTDPCFRAQIVKRENTAFVGFKGFDDAPVLAVGIYYIAGFFRSRDLIYIIG